MSQAKREKRFLEVVKRSGLVAKDELSRALAFQTFAHARGKALPLDRILLKFSVLDEPQIERLYANLRYYSGRKEDKVYAKISVQSKIVSGEDAKRCLKEQKRVFKEKGQFRRFNEIARDHGLLGQKEDNAILTAYRKLKPGISIAPLGPGGGKSDEASSHGPAKAGEGERWKKNARARDLAELSDAAKDDDAPDGLDDPPPGVGAPPLPQLSPDDDDLDPLWDEADLDEIELDSGAKDAKRPAKAAADDDDDDLLD